MATFINFIKNVIRKTFLLREEGGYILLETGGKIILDTGTLNGADKNVESFNNQSRNAATVVNQTKN
jgi:hypothetical protein